MATTIGSAISAKVLQLITGPTGVNSVLAALTQGSVAAPNSFSPAQVRSQNVAPDVADLSNAMQYPSLNVYCEKITNSLTEKFRSFSGAVQMAIELRHSQDRLDGLQDNLELYAAAVMQVLATHRGDWGDGDFYAGEYQAAFGAVKHGGKNFIQIAKITFEMGVSKN
ncbi:MAG: hypothetical protein ABSB88_01630 [Bryobacteraceae bacterium]|jgi:hypothetical protein